MFKNCAILILITIIAYQLIPGKISPEGKKAKGVCDMYEQVAQHGLQSCLESHDRTSLLLAKAKRDYSACDSLLKLNLPTIPKLK